MPIFTCKRCGHESTSKFNMIQHLKRKVPCEATHDDICCSDLIDELTKKTYNDVTYDCEYCHRKFNNRSNRCNHLKVCKEKPENKSIDTILKEMKKLKEEVAELRKEKTYVPPIGTMNINNGTINNINIHAFGKEDISYIVEHPRLQEALFKAVKQRGKGLMYILNRKHFHPDHPENHNIKKLNKKSPFVDIYDGNEWVPTHMEEALDDIFLSLQNLFANFVESAQNIERIRTIIDQFMKEVGSPLGWDVDCESYTYDQELSEKDKEKYKKKLCELACEVIYRRSKEVFAT